MEFPEGRGGSILGANFGKSKGEVRGYRKNPLCGGYGYLLELHNGPWELQFTIVNVHSFKST